MPHKDTATQDECSAEICPWRKRFWEGTSCVAKLPHAQKRALIDSLPDDMVVLVLITATSWESSKWSLRAQDIFHLVCASKRFSFLVVPAQSEDLWNWMTSHFVHLVAGLQQPLSDIGTVKTSEFPADPDVSALELYKLMSTREKCRRCGVRFHRGANFENCKLHTGVMISGHKTNGLSATWTCCGRKGHSDGCTDKFHVPEESRAASGGEASRQDSDCRAYSDSFARAPNSTFTCLDMLCSQTG